MKTEALIILKKVQSLQRGQDLHDVWNSDQELGVKIEQLIVILTAQFSRRSFPTWSKVKICEDTKGMKEKLKDQAEEKYRVSSEWVEPTSV